MTPRRGFTLVLTMFLVVLLTTAGAGLALTAATESSIAGSTGRDLDHRLAVDSFLLALPALLRADAAGQGMGHGEKEGRRISVVLAGCQIECEVQSESSKLLVGQATKELQQRMVDLARDNGLASEDLRLRPIVQRNDVKAFPAFVWFDQLVAATEFEEVFRLRLASPEQEGGATRRNWSDLVTFWQGGAGRTLALNLHTRCGNDRRRWYLVVAIDGDETKVLFRGPI